VTWYVTILYVAALAFFVMLWIRLVLDWVQHFARDWRPRGPVLLVAEGAYSVTDPPLRAIRRLLPPVRIGGLRLDVAFMVLFFACLLALNFIPLL
jgi:YggT family protein